LEINSRIGNFEIRSFNDIKVNRILKMYVGKKQKSLFDLTGYLVLICLGILILFAIMFGVGYINKR
jgi:hypothetical protein